jgi:hypothetical protein
VLPHKKIDNGTCVVVRDAVTGLQKSILNHGFISPDDPRWVNALRQAAHDLYDLPDYARVAACWEQGTPTAFYAEQGSSVLLIPLIRRPLPDCCSEPQAGSDLASPYGYPSIITAGDDEWMAKALKAFRHAGREMGAVTAFLRLHPLLPQRLEVLSQLGVLVRHGQTVYIDLTRSEEELWAETRSRYRSYIRRLQRERFRVTLDEWDGYDECIDAYLEAMDRLEAARCYRFPRSYFLDLYRRLGSHLHLCRVMAPSGQLACAGLFISYNGMVQYHLGASKNRYRALGPSKLMIHFMRSWAQRTGHRALHLGGGYGGAEETLMHFKSGFAHNRADFFTMRMIFDPEKYQKLIAHRQVGTSGRNFFPAYRN